MTRGDGSRPLAPSDDDYPDDLFEPSDTPVTLETLPPEGGSTSSPASEPVGYGNPPQHTRWQKNGPSPNPRGRPRKRAPAAPLTHKMNAEVDAELHGRSQRMTRRAVLDRIVRDKAVSSGAWLKLWESRLARDQALQDRIDAHQRHIAAMTAGDHKRVDDERRQELGDKILKLVEAVAPGLLDTQRKLEQLGLLDSRGNIRGREPNDQAAISPADRSLPSR